MSFYIFHRDRVCLVDHVDLIFSLYSWQEGFGSSSLGTLPPGFNFSFISTSACGSTTGVCSWGCPGGFGFVPVKARCGGSTAAWVTGVLAALGTQGSWRLGQQEMQCSRRIWQPVLANTLLYSCLEKPFPDREAQQAIVCRVTKSWTLPKQPCVHRHETFSASGSSAPVRIESEGGTATWLVGTLVAPSVQGHGLPLPQQLWPYRSLFSNLLQLVIRSPLWPVFLHSSASSGTQRASLPQVLLCCSACQALIGAPCVGFYSVARSFRQFDGPASLLFSC